MHKKLCSGLFCDKTILNALRFRSGHIQRKIYFYFAILENLRIFQNCLFTDGVVEENGICSACFLRKRSRCEGNVCWSLVNPLRLTAFARFPLLSLRDIFPPERGKSFLSGGAFTHLSVSADKAPPSGELARRQA